MSDPTITFTSSVLVPVALGTLGMLGAGAAVGLMAAPKIAARVLPKPKETRLADFLPFEEIESDGKTVKCRGDILCQFLSLQGVDQTFLPEGEAKQMAITRKTLYDQLSDTGVMIRYFLLREPIQVDTRATYPNPFAAEIARRWNKQYERAYKTQMVLVLSRKGSSKIDRQKLEDAITIAESILSPYNPRMLTQNPEDAPGRDMTIGSFLGRLVSPVSQPSPRLYGDGLNDALASDEVHFLADGRMRFRSVDKAKYVSVIGIKRFGVDISSLLANELASLPHEVVMFQSITPLPKTETMLKLRHEQKMVSGASFSQEVYAQYQSVIEMIEGLDDFRQSLCAFGETIFVYGDTLEEMQAAEKACRQILNAHGITPAIEKGASQASWFHQFPGYDDRPRLYRLTSTNIAMLATFDRAPTGLDRSDWGKGPIALFHTGANTIYSFQFHATPHPAAVGHGVCIAPTGAGKTVLMEFLSCLASRHKDLRHFFFDRYQGTYVYTTAMQGKYLGFNAAKQTLSIRGGMNPFQCEESEENIDFLKNFLRAISGRPKEDYDGMEQISQAVDMAFETLPRKDRSLAAIYEPAFTANSDVKRQLHKWVDPSQYGNMFNAVEDCIDLEGNWLTTFDMTNLFDDETLAAASVSYITHRIRQTMRRNRVPGFIFIDETAPLLLNQDFHDLFRTMLQEFRKLSGVVMSVFQRPQAMRETHTSDLIRSQCSTYYLFPNPGATAKEYEDFELTEREIAYVLGQSPIARRTHRSLLVKRPQTRESVILDIDLSGLGPMMRILSSTSRDVGLASDFQRQYGPDWVQRYVDAEAP